MEGIIQISAKCSDLFSANFVDNHGNYVGRIYQGYVPDFFPGQHYGDYILLNIDVHTGQILNWKKPSKADLQETFKF